MTREESEQEIQRLGAEVERLVAEQRRLADPYKIEFSVLGQTMHYSDRWDKGPGLVGLLVSDSEWESSTYGCSSEYWDWHQKAFPEKDDEDDDD